MTSRLQRIKDVLMDQFKPTSLDIIDDTESHKGHAGSPGTEESHITVVIQADEFKNISRVEAHRKVYDAISTEFQKGLHAVSVKFKSVN